MLQACKYVPNFHPIPSCCKQFPGWPRSWQRSVQKGPATVRAAKEAINWKSKPVCSCSQNSCRTAAILRDAFYISLQFLHLLVHLFRNMSFQVGSKHSRLEPTHVKTMFLFHVCASNLAQWPWATTLTLRWQWPVLLSGQRFHWQCHTHFSNFLQLTSAGSTFPYFHEVPCSSLLLSLRRDCEALSIIIHHLLWGQALGTLGGDKTMSARHLQLLRQTKSPGFNPNKLKSCHISMRQPK